MHIDEDLQFWGIDKNLMDACCALTHYPELELSQKESDRDKKNRLLEAERVREEDFGETWLGKTRSFLWNLTEYPERSLFARVNNKYIVYIKGYLNVLNKNNKNRIDIL